MRFSNTGSKSSPKWADKSNSKGSFGIVRMTWPHLHAELIVELIVSDSEQDTILFPRFI